MRYEEDDNAGSNSAGEPPRGRHDEHDSPAANDASTDGPEQRADDRNVRAEDSALSEARDKIDAVDEAIEAEFVDEPTKNRSDLRAVVAQWSGELPHPADAERYEAIAPGTLDRLIRLKERQMGAVEHELRIDERREETIRSAVDAESDVKRSLATADRDALKRGQYLSWTISLTAMAAVIVGLSLGYPQALWAIGVPIVQAGASLVRTVTQSRSNGDHRNGKEPPKGE
ncbi:hypothetical protein SEA_PHRANN_32 [Mycobacterium phage Phrann]|uniref:DUF2335 domain-containing protein n=1 Tax=Mycobacterium phage Phrann TaxID=1821541 RepID=A0A142K825_9CAUD|nr:hypothetical protein BJD68_gp32 [Mycobacterium phage Phrann]AMS02258.1 hypothetical protein SEA_PHRANN_32 [Mycobacterium phage Phrann]